MEKLKMHTPDLAEENYKKLAALFPDAVTETIDDNGNVVRAIDKDVLMQEINAQVVDDGQERYQFTWPDKRKSVVLANAPIAKTLCFEREKSVGRDGTPGGTDSENIYIEGDNLDALKLLQETYLGKVKMIYIDPPYNTGNDFIYEDDFSQESEKYIKEGSGQYDDEGNRLVQNTESNGRFHTDWLNMLYPRLRIAKDLMTSDGVIFISIDDNEAVNLKKICDEVFGESNFVAQLAVQLNPRGRNLDIFIARTFEYVLVYAKNYLESTTISGVEKEGKMVEEYNKEDEKGKYRAIGLRNRNQSFNPQTRPNLYYPLYVDPHNQKVSTVRKAGFTDEVWPDAPDGTKTCWTWMAKKVDEENDLIIAEKTGEEWRIYRKDYLIKDGELATTLVKSLWTDNTINNDYGKKSIKELFGSNVMSFPKAPDLIKRMIKIGTLQNSIVMDFFSGSATTAQAMLELNSEDRSNRKFIMVQLPEILEEKSLGYKAGYKTICDIGEERIRRAGKKIKKETGADIDYGFRCFKVNSSNMKDVYYRPADIGQMNLDQFTDNIKEDRTPDDLLIQVMLDLGVLLSSKVEETEIAGKKVFSVADGYLIACFDKNVTEDVVTAIAKQKPFYAVFRDSSMANDSVAANFEQIFATYSPQTVRKVL
jgi:adenine-specific DNA-methyltransferase